MIGFSRRVWGKVGAIVEIVDGVGFIAIDLVAGGHHCVATFISAV